MFSQVAALKEVNIKDEDKVLVMPYQYYYFEETDTEEYGISKKLHCYFPVTKVDVTLEYELPQLGDLLAIWANADNSKVFFVEEEGGTEIRFLTVYEIDSKNKVTELLSLRGNKPCEMNSWSEEDNCHIIIKDDAILLKGYDANSDTGKKINKYVTREFKPYILPVPSVAKIEEPKIGFTRITADGVNVRKSTDSKSPRAGYWRCRECEQSDMANPLSWENQKGTPPFTPYHPDKNEIYTYSTESEYPSDWQPLNIHIDFERSVGYVAKQFTEEVQPRPFSENVPLLNKWLQSNILICRDGKYTGLWIYFEPMGMDNDARFHLGKLVNGKVVFYGTIECPIFSHSVKGIEMVDGELCYGMSKSKKDEDGNIDFDITKLTDDEFDLLYATAVPKDSDSKFVLVGFSDHEEIFYFE